MASIHATVCARQDLCCELFAIAVIANTEMATKSSLSFLGDGKELAERLAEFDIGIVC